MGAGVRTRRQDPAPESGAAEVPEGGAAQLAAGPGRAGPAPQPTARCARPGPQGLRFSWGYYQHWWQTVLVRVAPELHKLGWTNIRRAPGPFAHPRPLTEAGSGCGGGRPRAASSACQLLARPRPCRAPLHA